MKTVQILHEIMVVRREVLPHPRIVEDPEADPEADPEVGMIALLRGQIAPTEIILLHLINASIAIVPTPILQTKDGEEVIDSVEMITTMLIEEILTVMRMEKWEEKEKEKERREAE